MGGQYALACAAGLGERVTRTVVVAGALPLDDDDTFDQLNAMDRRLTRLAQHHPHVARDVFRSLGEVDRHRPEAWAHLTTRGAVPEEGAALDALPDPGIAHAAAHTLEHGDGMVEEYVAWARPWASRPTRSPARSPCTRARTTTWSPRRGPTRSRRPAAGRLVRHEGAGHFLTYADPRPVLATFADA